MTRIIPKLGPAGTTSMRGETVHGDEAEEPAHRRVAAEHRSLDALFGETSAILRVAEARGAARLAITHLLEAVKSHLFREESLYYPTIWALRPDYMSPLRLLVDSHAHFRSLLDAITECVERAAHEDAERRFEEFTRLFQEHEEAEEKLLETLEQELSTAR
jgi:iron-sulfur cluster repair protein YtfE (RIC family)